MKRNWEVEPTISTREGAILYNTSVERFRRIFKKELADKVRYFRNKKGNRLLLTDMMHVTFPEADDYTIHMMSLDFLWRTRLNSRIKHGGKPAL